MKVDASIVAMVLSSMSAAGPDAVSPPAWVEVHAPSHCLTDDELKTRIEELSTRIAFRHDHDAIRIDVKVSSGDSGVTSQLTFARPNEPSTTRRVLAPSCAEAREALALIIAVALDPWGMRQHASPAPPSSAPPPDTSPIAPTPEALRTAPLPATPPSPSSPTGPAVAAERSRVRPWHFTLGLGGMLLDGPAPGLLPGGQLALSLGAPPRAAWDWQMGAALAHLGPRSFQERGGRASFMLDLATFQLCPWGGHAGRIGFHPCAAGTVGRLEARGSETEMPASYTRLYADLGATFAFSWTLSERWTWVAQVNGALPLVRDAYAFAPWLFFRTSPVTRSLGLTLVAELF